MFVNPDETTGLIVSPHTRRADRIPPGQSQTVKWPVLDTSGPPRLDQQGWQLGLEGLVHLPRKFDWEQFDRLPKVKVLSDFHCVTRWSRMDNLWEGVATRVLVEASGGLKADARFVLAHGYDGGWTTNIPLELFLAEDALVATSHDGQPLALEHGGPARLVIPGLYAWKSAKWLRTLEFLQHDRAGFWERNGYHMNGDPWREQRFGY